MQTSMTVTLFLAGLLLLSTPQPTHAGAAAGKKKEPTKEEVNQVTNYGPDNCVSTYPSDAGTCILKTDCKENSLKDWDAGIVCADNSGETVRHVFGKDSFSHKETFDTLIPCTQCLAVDNFDSGKDTEEAVLKDEVDGLKKEFQGLEARVVKLEDGGEKPAEEPAEEPKPETEENIKLEELNKPTAEELKAEAEEPKAEETKAFLSAHHAPSTHKKHKQSHHHHRRPAHKKHKKKSRHQVEKENEEEQAEDDDLDADEV